MSDWLSQLELSLEVPSASPPVSPSAMVHHGADDEASPSGGHQGAMAVHRAQGTNKRQQLGHWRDGCSAWVDLRMVTLVQARAYTLALRASLFVQRSDPDTLIVSEIWRALDSITTRFDEGVRMAFCVLFVALFRHRRPPIAGFCQQQAFELLCGADDGLRSVQYAWNSARASRQGRAEPSSLSFREVVARIQRAPNIRVCPRMVFRFGAMLATELKFLLVASTTV